MRRSRPGTHARLLAAVALGVALLAAPAVGQDSQAAPGSATTPPAAPAPDQKQPDKPGPAAAPAEPQPQPYSPEEFPQWLSDLRRGEIVAIGAFPIVYLFTQLGYNVYRYSAHGGDPEYAPLGNPNQVPYTKGETIGVLLGAASLSVVVATADYLIGRVRAGRRASGGKP